MESPPEDQSPAGYGGIYAHGKRYGKIGSPEYFAAIAGGLPSAICVRKGVQSELSSVGAELPWNSVTFAALGVAAVVGAFFVTKNVVDRYARK